MGEVIIISSLMDYNIICNSIVARSWTHFIDYYYSERFVFVWFSITLLLPHQPLHENRIVVDYFKRLDHSHIELFIKTAFGLKIF